MFMLLIYLKDSVSLFLCIPQTDDASALITKIKFYNFMEKRVLYFFEAERLILRYL